jgi:hypothetical protein
VLLTHGTLRWSDLQRTREISLGRDLIYGKSVMKRKSVLTPWVASRFGFSGKDWGAAWYAALQSVNLPGPDFLLFEPASLTVLRPIPASYSTILNFMRIVLCFLGLTINQALEYSLHSWRHLYPTLSAQLGLDPAQQEAIGHWNKGSSMPIHYDAMTNSLEIRAKQHVVGSVRKGYKIGNRGEFLMDDPVVVGGTVVTDVGAPPSPAKDVPVVGTIVVEEKLESTNHSSGYVVWEKVGAEKFEHSPVQVVDAVTRKVHLRSCGGRAVCNTWSCGTPDNPLIMESGEHRAVFQVSHQEVDIMAVMLPDICQSCFSEYNTKKFKEVSLGLIDIPSYYEARVSAFEDVSSDGDSGLSTYSL